MSYKVFIGKFFGVFSIITIVAIVIGYYLQFQFQHDTTDKFNYMRMISDEKFDYALLGSSRTLNMIDVLHIDSNLNKRGINLGVGGADYKTLYLIIVSFVEIQDNQIEQLLIQIDPFMLCHDSTYNKPDYNHYFYNISENDLIHSTLADDKARLYKYLPILKFFEYNSVYNLTHFIKSFSKNKTLENTMGANLIDDGAIYSPSLNSHSKNSQMSMKINFDDLFYFEKIIDMCFHHNIKCILYTAPIYDFQSTIESAYSEYLDYTDTFCKSYSIHLLNHINSYRDSSDFKDRIHTNLSGTLYYSDSLIKDLREIITE